jgi:hypothetical protein
MSLEKQHDIRWEESLRSIARASTAGPFPLLAHSVISLRCGIWSLPGHSDIEQTTSIKLDL